MENILIVCVGNICRSPMAEGLLRHQFAKNNTSIRVTSAGLAAVVDKPAAAFAELLMKARHIDISAHRARQLTEQMVLSADLILTMEIGHKKQIERLYPYSHGKVFLLGQWRHIEVPDPFGRDQQDFEQALTLIEKGLEDWQNRICKR